MVVGRSSSKSAPIQPLHGTARGTSLRVGRSPFESAPNQSFHGTARGTSLVVARSYSKSAPAQFVLVLNQGASAQFMSPPLL